MKRTRDAGDRFYLNTMPADTADTADQYRGSIGRRDHDEPWELTGCSEDDLRGAADGARGRGASEMLQRSRDDQVGSYQHFVTIAVQIAR